MFLQQGASEILGIASALKLHGLAGWVIYEHETRLATLPTSLLQAEYPSGGRFRFLLYDLHHAAVSHLVLSLFPFALHISRGVWVFRLRLPVALY